MGKEATQFKPGQSGNPNGRPKKDTHLKRLCRAHTEEAITKLIEIMRGNDPKDAMSAAVNILNRGWGTPPQGLFLTDDPADDESDSEPDSLSPIGEFIKDALEKGAEKAVSGAMQNGSVFPVNGSAKG